MVTHITFCCSVISREFALYSPLFASLGLSFICLAHFRADFESSRQGEETGPAGTAHTGGALPNCQCLGRQKLSGARLLKFIIYNVVMASAGKSCCLHVTWMERNTQRAYALPCTMPLHL